MARLAAAREILDRAWGERTQPFADDADMTPINIKETRAMEDDSARNLALLDQIAHAA
jgi:hypothetical protein